MRSLRSFFLHPIQPAPLVIEVTDPEDIVSTVTQHVDRYYSLGIAIPLRNITSRSTPLPTPTIKDNFLSFAWFIEPVLRLECIWLKMQRVGDDRKRDVDRRWDRALDHFVWFSYVY